MEQRTTRTTDGIRMRRSLLILILLLLSACGGGRLPTEPKVGPSLARAMCEAGYSFVALQKALSDPDNGIDLGQRPCSAQITFHVTATSNNTNSFNLKLALPVSTANIEGGGSQSNTATTIFDNQMNMQVENPVCSVKDYLSSLTKTIKDNKAKGLSTKDIVELYDAFDSGRRVAGNSGGPYNAAQVQATSMLAIRKCAGYN